MTLKPQYWWQQTRASFWFVPTLIVLGAIGLASGLIAMDANLELPVDKRWPLLFDAGAAGSRDLLTAVASSMITVAGVVFSITIVALSLTSSQYTSRVLRNFMRDRMNQVVLGVFVGNFAYCLVVLRTIRAGDEGAFVPSLAVLGGLVLAFVGIGFLIYFIHHISMSIQASTIIAAAAEDSIAAVDHLFPEGLGDDADEDLLCDQAAVIDGQSWSAIVAGKTGYIESVDGDALLAWARKHASMVRMERGIGEFVIEGSPLISVADPTGSNDEATDELKEVFVISRQRTVEQDVGFGVRQIVDVAMKALSPGINDTTTAVMCVDYLGAILTRLAGRRIPKSQRLDKGELRVIARGPCFESLLAEGFDQIRQNAGGNVAILTRQLETLEVIAGQTANIRRRQSLQKQADRIVDVAERTIPLPHDLAGVKVASVRLAQILNVPSGRPPGSPSRT
ncbi:MAG: DUF2254 domain-containing protein [Planctomycetaceae bacterium]|nr:MAG: DUF2254 domain-containing protein [Planctomycetaceae bacterium]